MRGCEWARPLLLPTATHASHISSLPNFPRTASTHPLPMRVNVFTGSRKRRAAENMSVDVTYTGTYTGRARRNPLTHRVIMYLHVQNEETRHRVKLSGHSGTVTMFINQCKCFTTAVQ
jgi:hypothetical protein